jgi:hypothetical protein
VELLLAGAATVAALSALGFTAYQTRLMARAQELSFNLQVMERLQEVLWAAADDPDSYSYAWGRGAQDNQRPQLTAHAILDVVSMALAAVDRLPGFSRNGEDWRCYVQDILRDSSNLRTEVLAHPLYWPEVFPFAQAAEREVCQVGARKDPDSGAAVETTE